MEQPAVFASLRSVQGAAPLARLTPLTLSAPEKWTPAPASVPLPRALQPNNDTLTAHRERPGGRSFLHPFSEKEGNTMSKG